MTKKKKIILSISSVLLVLILYGWFFGVQTFFVLSTRWFLKAPMMEIVPQPMNIGPCSEPVMTVQVFDYSFSIPWAEFSKNGSFTSMVWWTTSSTNISIACFAPEEGLYSAMLNFEEGAEGAQWRQQLISELGLENVTCTNYYMYSKMWNVTPRDISLFDSRTDLAINSILLMMKGIAVPTNLSSVHSFATGRVKGFQMGSLPDDQYVHLTIFDQMDRECRMVIGAHPGSPISVTQEDINTIITTFSVEP